MLNKAQLYQNESGAPPKTTKRQNERHKTMNINFIITLVFLAVSTIIISIPLATMTYDNLRSFTKRKSPRPVPSMYKARFRRNVKLRARRDHGAKAPAAPTARAKTVRPARTARTKAKARTAMIRNRRTAPAPAPFWSFTAALNAFTATL